MTELKTRSTLLVALRQATTRRLSASEMHKQKISFIMGSTDAKSGVTRSRIEEVLASAEGYKAA